MSTADELEFLRRLHGTGHRTRSRAEARAELVAACESLGARATEWRANAFVPAADYPIIDAAIVGIGRLLQELRAEDRASA